MLSLLLLFQASVFPSHPLAKPFYFNAAQQAQVKEAVGRELKDPMSAQYEWRPVVDEYIYCGTVNARNGFGGYSGPKLFAVLYARNEKSGKLFIGTGSVFIGDDIAIKMCEAALNKGVAQ